MIHLVAFFSTVSAGSRQTLIAFDTLILWNCFYIEHAHGKGCGLFIFV